MATRTRKAVEAVDEEATFEPASVEVILPRKVKTVWHILNCRVSQKQPNRSHVKIDEEKRVTSASSGIDAIRVSKDLAKKSAAMVVLLPEGGSSLFAATCPKHGLIRQNSTVEYAMESAYWHALEKHSKKH